MDIEPQNQIENKPRVVNFTIWREAVETATKSGVAITGIAYIIGLLILNMHIRKYGVRYLSFLQIEYVMVGILLVFLVALVYFAALVIMSQIIAIYNIEVTAKNRVLRVLSEARHAKESVSVIGASVIFKNDGHHLSIRSDTFLSYQSVVSDDRVFGNHDDAISDVITTFWTIGMFYSVLIKKSNLGSDSSVFIDDRAPDNCLLANPYGRKAFLDVSADLFH